MDITTLNKWDKFLSIIISIVSLLVMILVLFLLMEFINIDSEYSRSEHEINTIHYGN
jgi:uncharacterized membrane protein